jgi:hypothetical protein
VLGLRAARYGVTSLDGRGATGPVEMVFTVVPRKELEHVLTIIRRFDPQAFYSVDEIQEVGPGIFPGRERLRGVVPSVLQPAGRAACGAALAASTPWSDPLPYDENAMPGRR